MLKAIVIDDIEAIRKNHIAIIKSCCPNISVIGQADSVESGVKLIRQLSPDLVFLDVEMPDGTGFDLLQKLKPIAFKVIFITGHEDFAIRAFRFSAIDYLLKPLDADDLAEAVKKAEDSLGKELFDIKLQNLFANLDRPKDLQKLVLKTSDRIYSVNIQDIVCCESDKNYTTFDFINAPKLVVSTNLKEYETLLVPYNFFRTHKSHLINMAYFDHFVKADGGNKIVMKNKLTVPLSVRKKEEFLVLLENL
ncbi:DNA-binding response regulator [Flavobacterium noncentrifugens]|uniref:Two component transcriptional regulator, LytTR family n=1 Tax=Flavobacterium noncentrifugens TaxID=1128970 RepID=A0A1G8Y8P4_9FLAO|nr:LytTR family DNA-binding domain-containing protein [Flavobacterium noncentrifugens]GEP51132.1 DNA-binding response regulator [Flavobacterium noncentrifugens]SDJ99212.1 two component transcriptional regulator, LytTR family [Flavobacterium noncentrifugens]